MNMTARLFLTSLISASLFAIAANADTPPNKSVPPLMPPPAMGESPASSDVAAAPAEAPIEMGAPAAPTAAPVVATTAPAVNAKPAAKPAAKAAKKPASKKPAARKAAAPKFPEVSVPLKPGAAEVSVKTRVNVRGKATTKSEVLTRLSNGEPVSVIEEIVRENKSPEEPTVWAKIALPAGTHAWVFGQFVDATSKAVTVKKLNVRGGPGENYSVLTTLKKGDVVTQVGEKQGWLEIEAPTSAVAYVAAAYLKQEIKEEATPAEPTEPAIAPIPVESGTITEEPGIAAPPEGAPTTVVAAAPEVDAAQAASPAQPTPEIPMILDPSIKREVEREGIVRRTWSIQAPSDFQLVSPETGEKIVYLHSPTSQLDLRRYKGLRIIVTGEEGLDKRWVNTPVLTIRRIQVVE